jgi:MFS family permease
MLVALPMMSTDMLVPALPIIVEQLETDSSLVKLTLIAYMAGFSLSILILGVASDKYGRKPCVLIATGIFSLATLGCIFSNNIEFLITFRFLQALGIGGCTVLVRAIIRDTFEEKEAIGLLAMIAASMTLSAILSPVIGGFIVEYYNWKAIFLILLVIGISLSILSLYQIEESNLQKDIKALHLGVLKSGLFYVLQTPDS